VPTYPQSIAAQLAALVTEVHRGTAPEAAGLRDLIDSACEHVPGAQYVGITMADHADGITTVAASHRYPALLDEIQQRYQEGPCVSAAWEHATICIRDLETDHRWPRYRHEVLSQSPIRSVMAFELFADGPTMGALNFYAERPHAFDQESVELGLVFATQCDQSPGKQGRAGRNREKEQGHSGIPGQIEDRNNGDCNQRHTQIHCGKGPAEQGRSAP